MSKIKISFIFEMKWYQYKSSFNVVLKKVKPFFFFFLGYWSCIWLQSLPGQDRTGILVCSFLLAILNEWCIEHQILLRVRHYVFWRQVLALKIRWTVTWLLLVVRFNQGGILGQKKGGNCLQMIEIRRLCWNVVYLFILSSIWKIF